MKDGEIDEFNMFDSYANAWTNQIKTNQMKNYDHRQNN